MISHPAAAVVAHRDTIGRTRIVTVACPHGNHQHTVGLTTDSAVVWCTHSGFAYTVTIDLEEAS